MPGARLAVVYLRPWSAELALCAAERCGSGDARQRGTRSGDILCAFLRLQRQHPVHTCSGRSGTPPWPEPAKRGCSSLIKRGAAS
jgi:hypothetical protein